jgi:NADPH:quinone reductase-like Zn-dependent oxidoreductase
MERTGRMKAIVYSNYGSPDVLKYEDVERPTCGEDDVLIRVRAASVNPYDWHFVRGTPYPIRIMAGLRKPTAARLGVDAAGRVEAVGSSVTRFKPGDEVFGACRGAFAEYASASESALVSKPANVTFEQAASAPMAALTALQGLRDSGHVQSGQQVLINGASGGVGSFAVQIAKSFGADVTGVCSTRNVAMVRSIGANRVIDYTQEDFTRGGAVYDLVLDCIGNRSLSACRRVLKPGGRYVGVGGPDGRWIGPLAIPIKALLLSPFVSQKMGMVMAKLRGHDDLALLGDLMASGKIAPVIDRRYPLSEVPQAIRYLEEGHARGKVVITVADGGEPDGPVARIVT